MYAWHVQHQNEIVLHDESVYVETACAHAARPHVHFTPPTDDATASLGRAQ
jgi:hypothetical protein